MNHWTIHYWSRSYFKRVYLGRRRERRRKAEQLRSTLDQVALSLMMEALRRGDALAVSAQDSVAVIGRHARLTRLMPYCFLGTEITTLP